MPFLRRANIAGRLQERGVARHGYFKLVQVKTIDEHRTARRIFVIADDETTAGYQQRRRVVPAGDFVFVRTTHFVENDYGDDHDDGCRDSGDLDPAAPTRPGDAPDFGGDRGSQVALRLETSHRLQTSG